MISSLNAGKASRLWDDANAAGLGSICKTNAATSCGSHCPNLREMHPVSLGGCIHDRVGHESVREIGNGERQKRCGRDVSACVG